MMSHPKARLVVLISGNGSNLQAMIDAVQSGIIKAIECLKHNGLLLVAEEASKLGTNNYTIVTSCYPNLNPEIDDGTQGLLVHGVIQGGTQGTPPVVDSVDTNHPLIINNHPSEEKSSSRKKPEKKGDLVDGMLYYAISRAEYIRLSILLAVSILYSSDSTLDLISSGFCFSS